MKFLLSSALLLSLLEPLLLRRCQGNIRNQVSGASNHCALAAKHLMTAQPFQIKLATCFAAISIQVRNKPYKQVLKSAHSTLRIAMRNQRLYKKSSHDADEFKQSL